MGLENIQVPFFFKGYIFILGLQSAPYRRLPNQ